MSMLAEPRRKQKWSLNPRGKQWSEDQNRFGQKMLEKMGWTAGKGLGANEQGITEHIRVKCKDDQTGIGYSNDHQDKEWTKHQENFNDFLQKLQTDEGAESVEKTTDLSGKSLELKSKQSRARVHYHKFTRGKDVNRYSTKDLANIFGKKDLNGKYENEVNDDNNENKEKDLVPVGAADKTAGVLTIKGGMMTDYFKTKMSLISTSKRLREHAERGHGDEECDVEREEKENERSVKVNDKSREQESESESERYVGFGYTNSHELSRGKSPGKTKELLHPTLVAFKTSFLEFNSPKSTPKKRKSEFYCSTPTMNDDKCNQSTNECQDEYEITPKKRKAEFFAFENPALNLVSPESSLPSTSSAITPLCSSVSRNKMEVVRSEVSFTENTTENYEISRNIPILTQDDSETTKKKKKKKRRDVYVEGFVNDALNIDDNNEDSSKNGLSEGPVPFMRNKMEVLRSDVPPIECIPQDGHESREEQLDSAKKKKKKCKKEPVIEGFINNALNFDDKVEETSCKSTTRTAEAFEVSRSDVFGLANDALDLADEVNGKKRVTFNDVVEYNTISCKKKKRLSGKLDKFEIDIDKTKKKKKSGTLKGILVNTFVNEALEVDIVDDEIIDNEENERKMNKGKRRRERVQKVLNLETIEEELEEDEMQNHAEDESKLKNDKGRMNEGFDDSLVKNTSDNLEGMTLNTPVKKKKKKSRLDKTGIDDNGNNDNSTEFDEVKEGNDDVTTKKIKKKKIKVINDNGDGNCDANVNSEELNGKEEKKKKSKSKKKVNIEVTDNEDMEVDELTVSRGEVTEENSNKENENSHDAKDYLKVGKKERLEKIKATNNRLEKVEDCEDVDGSGLVERDESSQVKKRLKKKKKEKEEAERSLEVSQVMSEVGDACMNNELDNHDKSEKNLGSKSPWQSKAKRPKKIFRALFAKAPVVHFAGSNINDIKGYGVS